MNINELYEQMPEELRGNIAVSGNKVTIKRDEKLTEEWDIAGVEEVATENGLNLTGVPTITKAGEYWARGEGKASIFQPSG